MDLCVGRRGLVSGIDVRLFVLASANAATSARGRVEAGKGSAGFVGCRIGIGVV